MSAPLTVAVVDDEPLARRRLERLIAGDPGLRLAGSYSHPLDARALMPDVDLLLLDIEMPFEDGFAMLDALPPSRCGAVIVVTAHARHALPAFRHEAVDFLLKPYDDASFGLAVARARRRLRASALLDLASAADALTVPVPARQARPEARLRVRADGVELLLDTATLTWIQADDKSVLLRSQSRTLRVLGRLAEFEQRLALHGFVRIHRSTLVNLACITAMRPCGHGDRVLLLADGSELALSRRYAQRVEALML